MPRLFEPITLRGLTLPNRIMVSPMCQYSALDGSATDWHLAHLGSLALSGAGLLCVEATAVTAEGRITTGDLGLYSDRNERALARVVEAIRSVAPIKLALQLAHAGRKASSHAPWEGGKLVPVGQGGWPPAAPSAVPHADGEPAPRALRAGRTAPSARGLRRLCATRGPARFRRDRTALRARVPAAPVPVAGQQPARRRVWRLARQPDALPARGLRCRPRGVPRRAPGRRAGFGHRLAGRQRAGELDRGEHGRVRPCAESSAAATGSTSPAAGSRHGRRSRWAPATRCRSPRSCARKSACRPSRSG